MQTITLISNTHGLFSMNMNSFTRLNALSEKVLCETATLKDLNEFVALLGEWRSCDDLHVYGDFYSYNKCRELPPS